MPLTEIQQVRLNVGDIDPVLPFLDDSSYQYFLDKNNNNITRASLDAARAVLLILSQRTDKTVDVLSISGSSRSAEQYRKALELYLRSPYLNPVLNSTSIYASGISLSDMQANDSNLDNNIVTTPNNPQVVPSSNPFLI